MDDGDPNAPHRVYCNLDQEFDLLGNQRAEQTPCANLAVAFHELARLPQTLELENIGALLKTTQVKSMRSEILLHPTRPHRCVVITPVALATMRELITRAPNTSIIKQATPISIEGPEATTKGI